MSAYKRSCGLLILLPLVNGNRYAIEPARLPVRST